MKASAITASFADYARQAAGDIAPVLDGALGEWEAAAAAQSAGALPELTGILREAAGGGKLLRGALVQLGYELAGGRPDERIFRAAAAYELLHSGFLIHDDIMDASPLRRGRPSAHVAVGGGHYGTAQAICLADAAFFLAHRVLVESGFEADVTVTALAEYSQVALDTAAGQMLDVQLSRPAAVRTEADVLRIYSLKTAAYTIGGPLRLGARLAGAPEQQLQAIAEYGAHVGLAYQIQDDILGIFSAEKVIGKPVTSDIAENKSTILITYAQSHATPVQREELDRLYGRGQLKPADIARVKAILTDCGAREYARRLAAAEAVAATVAANHISADAAHLALLTGLAEYSVNRNS